MELYPPIRHHEGLRLGTSTTRVCDRYDYCTRITGDRTNNCVDISHTFDVYFRGSVGENMISAFFGGLSLLMVLISFFVDEKYKLSIFRLLSASAIFALLAIAAK
jgi:hypothetical protein